MFIRNSLILDQTELEPLTDTYVQADEADMGMTYDELSVSHTVLQDILLKPTKNVLLILY
jgi:hypothetical protein